MGHNMKTLNLIFSSHSSLAVELNDISILNMISFVSRVEGHIQSGRAHFILDGVSFDKFSNEALYNSASMMLERFVYNMVLMLSGVDELGLIPAGRKKYTDELFQLGKSSIEIELFNLACSQGICEVRKILSDYAFHCHEYGHHSFLLWLMRQDY